MVFRSAAAECGQHALTHGSRYPGLGTFLLADGSSTGDEGAIEGLSDSMELLAVNYWNTSPKAPDRRGSILDPVVMVTDGGIDMHSPSPECNF